MIRLPDEPMLAAIANSPRLNPGWAAEPKWDGVRGWLIREVAGRTRLVSRRGTDLSTVFPELVAAAAASPVDTGDVAFDREVVIWKDGRTDFGRLLKRLGRRRAAAQTLARQNPAHFVAFDLLHLAGRDLMREPYRIRRAELEHVFIRYGLAEPWTLTPSTTDPDDVALWLTAWPPLGIKCIVLKRLDSPYQGGQRGWRKYRRADTVRPDQLVGRVGAQSRPRKIQPLSAVAAYVGVSGLSKPP